MKLPNNGRDSLLTGGALLFTSAIVYKQGLDALGKVVFPNITDAFCATEQCIEDIAELRDDYRQKFLALGCAEVAGAVSLAAVGIGQMAKGVHSMVETSYIFGQIDGVRDFMQSRDMVRAGYSPESRRIDGMIVTV